MTKRKNVIEEQNERALNKKAREEQSQFLRTLQRADAAIVEAMSSNYGKTRLEKIRDAHNALNAAKYLSLSARWPYRWKFPKEKAKHHPRKSK